MWLWKSPQPSKARIFLARWLDISLPYFSPHLLRRSTPLRPFPSASCRCEVGSPDNPGRGGAHRRWRLRMFVEEFDSSLSSRGPKEQKDSKTGGRTGMRCRVGKRAPNTAIYSPKASVAPPGPASTLDFAVRICGMSVAGTRPSGFLIAKRIRRDRIANPLSLLPSLPPSPLPLSSSLYLLLEPTRRQDSTPSSAEDESSEAARAMPREGGFGRGFCTLANSHLLRS